MSRKKLFLFILGQISIMSLARFFFQWILKFSTLEINGSSLFPVSLVGITLFAFRIFDAVSDPLTGTFSDYWISKGK
ncbi:MAG: hypothetical protein KDD56_05775, partial [Bdellovibrionales bacterium]|nr:hypothetical protein [Bdellovibrionales bacterium]